MPKRALSGRRLYFLFQGANPDQWMLDVSEYTIKRFAAIYDLTYVGMATNKEQAMALK